MQRIIAPESIDLYVAYIEILQRFQKIKSHKWVSNIAKAARVNEPPQTFSLVLIAPTPTRWVQLLYESFPTVVYWDSVAVSPKACGASYVDSV